MTKNKIVEWFFRLLFPTVLTGLIIYSIFEQPPLISSPEVDKNFRNTGAQVGYFEDAAEKAAEWPAGLPEPLIKSLKSRYGLKRPEMTSVYAFGTAKLAWPIIDFNTGSEAVLIPAQGLARQDSLSLFGFRFGLWATGYREGKSWSGFNGTPGKTDPASARRGHLLEQAAWLLPLLDMGLSWEQAGPHSLATKLEDGAELVLEFSGERLTRAALGGDYIIFSEWSTFGTFSLPTRWEGRWGQRPRLEFRLQGLLFNPPFAEDAVKGLEPGK